MIRALVVVPWAVDENGSAEPDIKDMALQMPDASFTDLTGAYPGDHTSSRYVIRVSIPTSTSPALIASALADPRYFRLWSEYVPGPGDPETSPIPTTPPDEAPTAQEITDARAYFSALGVPEENMDAIEVAATTRREYADLIRGALKGAGA